MSRDKHIEEMAWLKCCCHSNKGICGMDGKHCDFDCGSYHEAEVLYNAGYRKSTDVAEEIFAEIEKICGTNGFHFICTVEKFEELKKKYTENKGE